jgi:uncharacterized damage-inducible protein DinB
VIDRTNWIDRLFEFHHPVETFPCLVERLRGAPARLDEAVREARPEILTVKPDGKWSIQEIVGHLADVEALFDGRLDEFLAGAERLTAADMSNRKTEQAAHNDRDIESLLARFRKVRSDFIARLEQLDASVVGRSALHPRLDKPMRVIDMVLFMAEHDDHHLADITERKRAV